MERQLEHILEELQNLHRKMDDLRKIETPKTESNEIQEIAAALAQSQIAFINPKANKENNYFKIPFADLETLLAHVRPILAQNGIALLQRIHANTDGQKILRTMLLHTSGQWLSTELPLVPPKSDIQTLGSFTSYIKRMVLSSMIGIATSEEDDDGENSMAQAREIMAKGPRIGKKYDPKKESFETVTKDQLDELEYELADYLDLAEEIMDSLKLQSLADMPKSQYSIAVRRIREIKQMREGGKK